MSGERIPVAICERHVHLTQDIIEQLFCDKYRLHENFRTSQPNQFAAQEFVTLVGPRGRIPRVRVIGPPRSRNQIEISQSDARVLGISVPVRASGDLRGTPGIMVEGPRGCIRLEDGVIRNVRHIHLHSAQAASTGIRDGDRIDVVKADADPRVLFCDVLVRVSPNFRSELHLDADEGRAAHLETGEIVALQGDPALRAGPDRPQETDRL